MSKDVAEKQKIEWTKGKVFSLIAGIICLLGVAFFTVALVLEISSGNVHGIVMCLVFIAVCTGAGVPMIVDVFRRKTKEEEYEEREREAAKKAR